MSETHTETQAEGDWLRPVDESQHDAHQGAESETVIDAAAAAEHPEVAETVAKIKALRQSIDNVDTAIVSLLAERFKYTSQVGVLKARAGFAPADSNARTTRSNVCTASRWMRGSTRTSRKCTASSW